MVCALQRASRCRSTYPNVKVNFRPPKSPCPVPLVPVETDDVQHSVTPLRETRLSSEDI